MADTKISDLTAITGANTAADDDFVVVDTSAAQTKRITRDELRVGLYPGIDDNSSATAVTIDASGHVGIGTSSPAEALDVSGNILVTSENATPLHVDRSTSTGSATIQVSNSTHTTYLGTRSGGGFAIDDDANLSSGPWFVIDTSGNVGIGTTAPRAPLHVAPDQPASDAINVLVSQYRPNVVLEDLSGSTTDFQFFVDGSALQFRYGDASTDTKLASEAMRITSTGAVGIGTSSPDANLEVEETAGAATVNVRGSTDSIVRARQTGNTGNGYFSFGDSADIFVGGMQYDHAGDNMRFSVNNAERIRIDSSGKVGIGTSSPSDLLNLSSADPRIRLTNTGSGYCLVRTGGTDASLILDADAGNTGAGSDIIMRVDGSEKMRIDSGGVVDILGGTVELNGNQITGIQVTMADDAFATINPTGRYGGYITIVAQANGTFPQPAFSAFLFTDFGNSPYNSLVHNGANFEVSTSGPPTGTTGTNGKVTLFVGGTSGTFYLENRTGSTYTFQITLT